MPFPAAVTIPGLGSLVSLIKRTSPKKVDAKMLQANGIAPGNESYVLGTLKFINFLDESGALTDAATKFAYDSEEGFNKGLTDLVAESYASLFENLGPDAWTKPVDDLARFFRVSDRVSELAGKRKAATFIKLAELAGQRDGSELIERKPITKTTKSQKSPQQPESKGSDTPQTPRGEASNDPGRSVVELAVRVEVNLPATSDQSVYDAIFSSIRTNLINRDQS